MNHIKRADLLDYIVKTLSIVKNDRPGYFASLNSILKIFQFKGSFSEVLEIGKYLDTKGWADAIYILGDVQLKITTSGLIYIEEKGDEFDKKFLSIREELISESNEKLVIGITNLDKNPKEAIFNLIEQIKLKINQRGGETDMIKDLEIIKIETEKNIPDIQMIELKLYNIGKMEFVASEIQELKTFFSIPNN